MFKIKRSKIKVTA